MLGPSAGPLDYRLDLLELLLGGGEERVAFAGALSGELGVAADHEPLTGEFLAGDLGEVRLVKQRQLQIARAYQRADLGALQRAAMKHTIARGPLVGTPHWKSEPWIEKVSPGSPSPR